jgi:two-component system chemotaxis sensor kinase CheA
MTSREIFIRRLLDTFKVEAAEGLANIAANLIALEREQSESRITEILEVTYRDAHSLKGAARAVNRTEIETIFQSLEGVFAALKNKKIAFGSRLFDLLHHALDTLTCLLSESPEMLTDDQKNQVSDLVLNLTLAESGEIEEALFLKPTPVEPPPAKVNIVPEPVLVEIPAEVPKPSLKAIPTTVKSDPTIRVSSEKLEKVLYHSEEMLPMKQTLAHFDESLKSSIHLLNEWFRESSDIFSIIGDMQHLLDQPLSAESAENIDEYKLKRVFRFLEFSSSLTKKIEKDLVNLHNALEQESTEAGSKIESLLDEVKTLLAVPFSTIMNGFPKTVRDISKGLGKEVDLYIAGSEMEIDRRILEEITSPLMHLLRNSIDHGIEKPQTRTQNHKPEKGTIRITVERIENSRIEITFSDDGAGVDLERVKQKYIQNEGVSVADTDLIKEETLLDYLFKSGVTTSEMITDLSGRGLGLSIVKEKIEQSGGTISVKTVKGEGTEFKIQVPLSLVTFRGVYIRVDSQIFMLPISRIERVLQVDKSEIKTVGEKATIPYSGKFIPLIYLSDILKIPFQETTETYLPVIVSFFQGKHIGFVVDEILNEEIAQLKKFNNQLKRVPNIEGATISGSGKIVPILHVADLFKSAQKDTVRSLNENASKEKEKPAVLVVEDSITSRMLLKNILESSGYQVTTAIDGSEGFFKLKEGAFNIVISDVEMPIMNGFEMTAKIRSDPALVDMPVVLVTSLSNREDQEHGIAVGANAYIIKSSFDQSNLLEIIGRLIH